jgi:hypothetical protein
MTLQAVTEIIKTFDEVESRFNLRRSEDIRFFREWYEDLPELSHLEKEGLDIIRRRYLYHLSSGNLTEGTVTLLLGAPLLEKAGFYDPLYQIRGEAVVNIEIEGENQEKLRGRIDILVLQSQFWVILLESKRTGIALNVALPQVLTYMMGNPNPKKPIFGMVINGDGLQFLKLLRSDLSQYDISPVFSPIPLHNQLYDVLKILKRLGQIIV